MRLTLEDKERIVVDFSQRLLSTQALILAEYRGVSAEKMTDLRRKARDHSIHLVVLRNTLASRALRDTPFANLLNYLSGPLIYGIASDFLAASKLFYKFSEENELFVLRVASLDSHLLEVADIEAYAKLPGRDQLLMELMGTMQAPVINFISTLSEVPARFVRTLAAYRDSIS